MIDIPRLARYILKHGENRSLHNICAEIGCASLSMDETKELFTYIFQCANCGFWFARNKENIGKQEEEGIICVDCVLEGR